MEKRGKRIFNKNQCLLFPFLNAYCCLYEETHRFCVDVLIVERDAWQHVNWSQKQVCLPSGGLEMPVEAQEVIRWRL